MSNPSYEQETIKKMKAPGVPIIGKDSSILSEGIGIHNATPPTLSDGEYAQTQMDDLGNIKVSLGDPAQAAALSGGAYLPQWNSQVINEADPSHVVITYKMNGTTVATKDIVVVGTTTTITITVV